MVDKGSGFYKISIKSQLQDNDIEMYSEHDEGKSVATEKFIRILENKLYKYMNLISKKCILIIQLIQLISTTIHIIAESK